MRGKTVLPAVAMTAVSMVLTLDVVVMWLGTAVPWPVALVVGLGIDGGWLATLAYERRLAAQGDHSRVVTGTGWCFGLIAAGVLVGHALTAEESAGAWLAVAWLPIAAKALWLVHGLWERTVLTPKALDQIRSIQQEARDEAAVARAWLRAEAGTEETRLTAVTAAGARVARIQAKTAKDLSQAWSTLKTARDGEDTARALTSVTTPVTPGVTPRWELPIWGPSEPVPALETAPALTDEVLDSLVDQIRHSQTPPLSYREMASRFRALGHSASEVRLRAAWKRVTAADAHRAGLEESS
ncbi:protein spdB [Streptomyces violaceusniger]|uniref:protein spdB n=1 Tax=Streptomyces violaceusniger TaxID=68280 RepID=UPI003816C63E